MERRNNRLLISGVLVVGLCCSCTSSMAMWGWVKEKASLGASFVTGKLGGSSVGNESQEIQESAVNATEGVDPKLVRMKEYAESDEEAISLVRKKEEKEAQELKRLFHEKEITVGQNKVSAPINIVVVKGKELAQLKVKNQFDDGGGGYASCGYHALKNGREVFWALNGVSTRLSFMLNDASYVEQLFAGTSGVWRQEIVKYRALEKLRKDMSVLWEQAIRTEPALVPGFKSVKVQGLYRSALDRMSRLFIVPAIFEGKPIEQSTLKNQLLVVVADVIAGKSIEDVQSYYEKSPMPEANNDALRSALCTEGVLDAVVDVRRLTLLPKPILDMNNYEWLDGAEIAALARSALTGELKTAANVSFFVYEDVSLIGTDFDANLVALQEAARAAVQDSKHVVLFCIGTMKNVREKGALITGSRGHWFMLVWSHERAYVMDSAGNKSRLDDESVKNVISVFETMCDGFKQKKEQKE